jgi:phage terminase small subunit
MTARGRPAKPTMLKVLDGDRPDRINRSEPVPAEVDLSVPPPYLSDEAADVWRDIAPDRIRQKVLTAWDVEAFAAFCESLIILRSAHIGALVLAKPGQESPMAKFRQAVAVSSTLGGRFGWTPADRQKLSTGGSEDRAQGAERLLG